MGGEAAGREDESLGSCNGSDDDLTFWAASPASCAACPALWQLHIGWELTNGRPDSARKLLLRAVHECPGAKRLWLGGLARLSGGMGPRELSGMMSAMQERLMTRTEVMEVMLAALDSEGLAQEVAVGAGG